MSGRRYSVCISKNVDDEKKRYYEINQQLERLNDELNKITKAKDRAFGKEKLGYLDQEINKYKAKKKTFIVQISVV